MFFFFLLKLLLLEPFDLVGDNAGGGTLLVADGSRIRPVIATIAPPPPPLSLSVLLSAAFLDLGDDAPSI